MRPTARLYAKKAASRSTAVKMTQGGLYFLAESANLLLQKREEGLKIDSESERLKTCGGGLRSPSYRAMENHIQRKGMNKMNQTQTRSPRKRLLSLILAVILMIGLLPISAFATSASAQANDAEDTGYKYNIMFLDCGRKYFSVNSIKQIIDNASAAGFNYIQLAVGNDGLRFLLDDMSLTVNGTTYSSQQVSAAIHAGNEAYHNFDVDELTQPEMDEIIAYAASKGMGVIPCVNTPGHMDAILSAATSLTGTDCSYSGSARTIDVTNATAVAFTQALLQKYISYFAGKGCKLFNMGADEYANDIFTSGSMGFGNLQSTGKYSYYVTYVNDVAALIKDAGMTPMAFNDGIYFNSNTSSGTFDTDILICYWSNGWSSYTPMPAANLAAKGFKLINTHGDYYWVLGKSDWQCSPEKAKGFNYKTFQGGTINDPTGSMFCIWCDYPGAETDTFVVNNTADTIAAFGKALPKVKPVEGVKNVTKTDVTTGVSVTAPDLTGLTVKGAAAPSIDTAAEGKVLAYDVTPTTESGNYAEAASVSFKTPSGWDTSRVRGFVVNTDGTVTDGLTGVVENGSFTFTAPHFSVMGIYQLSADAPTETKDINVAVGGTVTVTVKRVNLSGIYHTENESIATVTVTGKGNFTGTASKTFTINKAGLTLNPCTISELCTETDLKTRTLPSDFFLAGETETGFSIKLTAVEGGDDIFAVAPAVVEGENKITFKLKNEVGAATFTVTVTPVSGNYNGGSYALTISTHDRTDVSGSISFPDGSAVYTGTGIKYENATISGYSGTLRYGYTPNASTGASLDASGLPLTVGTYTVAVTFNSDASFGYKTATFTITKATPTGTPGYTKLETNGKTLADAKLTVGTIRPAGTIAWDLPLTTVLEDGKAYAWTFTPNDTHNYTILTGTLVPYVDDGMDYIPGVIGGNTGSFNFHDVSRLDYFYDAVKWAAENGIASGTGRYTFSPNAVCTRAQTVTFLWRAAGSPLPRYRVCPFTDVNPRDYYYDAVLWAVEQGITTGLNATTFGPDVTVTRGQVATFLYRAASAAKPNTFNPFTDVKTTAYNYDAILWAYDNRITTGTSDTTFSPDAYCTRAQIVTFLYRYYQGR